jgi:hypothetical protein
MQSGYLARVFALPLSLIAGLLVATGFAYGAVGADIPAAATTPLPTLLKALVDALEQCPGDEEALGGAPIKSGYTPPMFVRVPNPDDYYSDAAKHKEAFGSLKAEMLVDRYGNPRFAHIVRMLVSAAPAELEAGTLMLVRHSPYKAATQGGQPVAVWKTLKISYRFAHGGEGGVYTSDDVKRIVTKARAGDHQAAVDLVHVYEITASETGITASEYSHFLAQAALAGSGEAKLTVSQRLGKPSCDRTPEVRDYLHKVAWGGFSPAELLMATRMLEAGNPTQYANAAILLHGAANSSDSFVQTWATGLLATSPLAEIRDPEFALQIARTLPDPTDPDELEVLAAAYGANGQFDEALKVENQAVSRAKGYGWNVSPFEVRRAAYAAKTSWVGNLCDCVHLVPSENP